MGMIDEQYKHHTLKEVVRQKEELFKELLDCKDEIRKLKKLLELNMRDFWELIDQRDWYYSLSELNKKRKV